MPTHVTRCYCGSSTPRLLSREEVQHALGVSRPQLWRIVRSGVLPVVYIDRRPRFLAEDVQTFVSSRRKEGNAA